MEEIEQITDFIIKIIDFIIKELNLIDDDSKSFLRGLAQENDYINDYHQSIRLLICIGIDLKYKLVDKNVMKKIFKTIDYAACLNCPNGSCIKCSAYFRKNLGCIRLLSHFEQATNQYTGIVKHNSQTLNTQFSNVKKADIFAEYYYPFIIGINAVPENFNNDLKWGNLDNVKFPNKNTNPKDKRGLIWVTPLQDILDIINDTKHENRANEITDRLGLSIQSETDYVYLEYDKIFNEILFQPCHLSTQWDNPHLYLSYKKFDGYGRTRQRKGDDESRRMKELVHESIDDDEKYVYNVKSLGRCTEYSENISNFVGESMKRYAL